MTGRECAYQHCTRTIPPRKPGKGGAPKKYCSRECGLRESKRVKAPKPKTAKCKFCGRTIVQSGPGQAKMFCKRSCWHNFHNRKKFHIRMDGRVLEKFREICRHKKKTPTEVIREMVEMVVGGVS